MKLKQFKKLLVGLDDDLEVIVSSDEEGNLYRPVDACGAGLYLDGEVFNVGDEYIPKKAKPAIVLYPC